MRILKLIDGITITVSRKEGMAAMTTQETKAKNVSVDTVVSMIEDHVEDLMKGDVRIEISGSKDGSA
jgi:YbbR domain-containing protein